MYLAVSSPGFGKKPNLADVDDRSYVEIDSIWCCSVVNLLQVSLSAFAFLFSELVQYNQTQVDNIAELERRWSIILPIEITTYAMCLPLLKTSNFQCTDGNCYL